MKNPKGNNNEPEIQNASVVSSTVLVALAGQPQNTDGRSGVRTIFFETTFPDGTKGVLILGKFPTGQVWQPEREIKSITVEYRES